MHWERHVSVFHLLALAFLCALFAVVLAADDSGGDARFLVARPGLPNDIFEGSVILMLPADHTDDLVVGLIVNKPTHKTLADVFPKDAALRKRTDAVYFGGPVDTDTPGILFGAPKPPAKAIHVFDDVYASFDPDFVVNALKKRKADEDLRVFLGRSQWGNIQIENEMRLHAWYDERADRTSVFSANPQDTWKIMLDREQAGPMAWLHVPQALDKAPAETTHSVAAPPLHP